jgi:hypothetical protein
MLVQKKKSYDELGIAHRRTKAVPNPTSAKHLVSRAEGASRGEAAKLL